MAIKYNFAKRKSNLIKASYLKWTRGENELVSSYKVKPEEVAQLVDCQLTEDGSIQFPRDGQAYYGGTSGSKVTGVFSYYKSDGTKELIRMSGTTLQKKNGDSWTNITGKTYTTTLDTNGVMAYDRLYLVNGIDALSYYDGSVIQTFTAISAPTGPSVSRTGGSVGSYTFSYKVTAVTNIGETLPTAAATATANQATLDTSVYMTFSWTAATNAVGYNVYGRKDGSWYFMKYIEGNSSTSYADKGTDTPNELFTPPDSNSTGGPVGTQIELYKDSLFIIGDPSNPSRLYYSGGGDKINDFSVTNGGGFVDINKNDGQKGTGLKVFKNTILVFKEDSIYQFSFATTGSPQVVQVTPAVGCVSGRSIVAVENDIFFAHLRGIFSIGNEQGFAIDVLRSNEISQKERPTWRSIAPDRYDSISAVYATKNNVNLIIFSYTPTGSSYNSKAIVYDRERLGWYKWNNIQANSWTNYIDSSGDLHVLYGDDNSGYVKEVLTGSDDFGTPISGYAYLRSESFEDPTVYKKLKDVSVVLRNPVGSANMSIVADGMSTVYQTNINTISPSINFGHYVWSEFLFGESYGTGSVTTSDEVVLRTKRNINSVAKMFQLRFDNGSSGASFVLMGVKLVAKPKSERYRKVTDLIT